MRKVASDLGSALRLHGVEAVFHLPGSAVVSLYAGLDDFELVLMKHPEAAGFAPYAYARIRGIGVALVAQGPGLAGIVPAVVQS